MDEVVTYDWFAIMPEARGPKCDATTSNRTWFDLSTEVRASYVDAEIESLVDRIPTISPVTGIEVFEPSGKRLG